MERDTISPNRSINQMIYRCFDLINSEDVPRFRKKFQQERDDESQVMHTFRELILGAYLSSKGLNVRHEYQLLSKNPDWALLDDRSTPIGIVELTNFHVDQKTEIEIEQSKHETGKWVGWLQDNDRRLYESIRRKASIYKSLVSQINCPYVISLFGEFAASVDFDELSSSLDGKQSGIFKQHEWVSGVLFFEESAGSYCFTYFPNPIALRVLHIPNGIF